MFIWTKQVFLKNFFLYVLEKFEVQSFNIYLKLFFIDKENSFVCLIKELYILLISRTIHITIIVNIINTTNKVN